MNVGWMLDVLVSSFFCFSFVCVNSEGGFVLPIVVVVFFVMDEEKKGRKKE